MGVVRRQELAAPRIGAAFFEMQIGEDQSVRWLGHQAAPETSSTRL